MNSVADVFPDKNENDPRFNSRKREEITDLFNDKIYDDPSYKVGRILKFESATLKITRIDRKNKRMWAQHTELIDRAPVVSHSGHDVVSDEYDFPFCRDCKVSITEPSTEDGDKKALDRADRTLADGTVIDE